MVGEWWEWIGRRVFFLGIRWGSTMVELTGGLAWGLLVGLVVRGFAWGLLVGLVGVVTATYG